MGDNEKCGQCGSITPCPINLAMEHTRTLAIHGDRLEKMEREMGDLKDWLISVGKEMTSLRRELSEFKLERVRTLDDMKLDIQEQIHRLWVKIATFNGIAFGAIVALDYYLRIRS